MLAPAAFMLFIFAHMRQFSPRAPIAHELLFVGLFAAFLVFNILVHRSLQGIEPVQFLRAHGKIFYTLSIFVVFFLLRPTARIESSFYHAAVYAAAIVSVVSLYSYFVAPVRLGPTVLESPRLMRGPLGGHTVTAGAIGLALAYVLAALWGRTNVRHIFPPRQKPLVLAATLVSAAAFVVAQSRGFALGLLVVVGLMALTLMLKDLRRRRLSKRGFYATVTMIVACGVMLAVMAPRLTGLEDDPNVTTRFHLWQRAAGMFAKSPVIGLGLGTFQQTGITVDEIVPGLVTLKRSGVYLAEVIHRDIEGGMHVHNVFLQVLSELGLVGLALLFMPFLIGLRRHPPAPESFTDPTLHRVAAAAAFNRRLLICFLVYLAVGGLAAGQTFTSPTLAWPIYIASARLARQHVYLLRQQQRAEQATG